MLIFQDFSQRDSCGSQLPNDWLFSTVCGEESSDVHLVLLCTFKQDCIPLCVMTQN